MNRSIVWRSSCFTQPDRQTDKTKLVAALPKCFVKASKSISKNGVFRSSNKQAVVPLFCEQGVATSQSLRTVAQNQARRVIMLMLTR